MLDDLEDVLIRADLGVATAERITKAIGKDRYDKDVDVEEVKAVLAAEVERALTPYALPLVIDPGKKPFVILVVGVNGSGKTTTIGKLAAQFSANGHSVLLAAGDTFRAAAIEQLKIWGERVACPVISREQRADASALAFDAIKMARERGDSVVLMDTAGRLQNRAEPMAELEKIIRVMKKVDLDAPHAVLLVLDATVGQNAMSQVEIFGRVAGVTGLVMTKFDGTARGGILVAIAEKFQLPIYFIGVGESASDLEAFEARILPAPSPAWTASSGLGSLFLSAEAFGSYGSSRNGIFPKPLIIRGGVKKKLAIPNVEDAEEISCTARKPPGRYA